MTIHMFIFVGNVRCRDNSGTGQIQINITRFIQYWTLGGYWDGAVNGYWAINWIPGGYWMLSQLLAKTNKYEPLYDHANKFHVCRSHASVRMS